MTTEYTSLSELNELQTKIVKHIIDWAHLQKTPIPLKDIIAAMDKQGVKQATTIKSVHVLLKKGYIRRAVIISNKSYFVLVRSV